MTEISFYVSPFNHPQARFKLAYRLVEKASERNMKVHIHCQSYADCERMDAVLWTSKETSFIPHGLLDHEGKPELGFLVSLGYRTEAGDALEPAPQLWQNTLLINLSLHTPDYFQQFTKLAEVIDQSDEVLANGRKRYSHYRKRGYNPSYYQL